MNVPVIPEYWGWAISNPEAAAWAARPDLASRGQAALTNVPHFRRINLRYSSGEWETINRVPRRRRSHYGQSVSEYVQAELPRSTC